MTNLLVVSYVFVHVGDVVSLDVVITVEHHHRQFSFVAGDH